MELNTYMLAVEAEMFGLITASSRPLRQIKAVCVNVKVIQPQNTHVKLLMTQGQKNREVPLVSAFQRLNVRVQCGVAN